MEHLKNIGLDVDFDEMMVVVSCKDFVARLGKHLNEKKRV